MVPLDLVKMSDICNDDSMLVDFLTAIDKKSDEIGRYQSMHDSLFIEFIFDIHFLDKIINIIRNFFSVDIDLNEEVDVETDVYDYTINLYQKRIHGREIYLTVVR